MQQQSLLFIQDLAVIMLIAGLITIFCHRFKQPVVLGYIIAGVIIGPHIPPFSFIYDDKIIKILAELGVVFLMFALGLEFNLHRLAKVGLAAIVAAVAEILLMTWVGYEIGLMFNWPVIDAIFLGTMLAISSTTIIVKALEDLGVKRESFSQLIFGILIVEDIFAIAILALLSSIAITGSLHIQDVMLTMGKLTSFLVVSLVLGIIAVPRLLSYVAKFKNNEMILIAVLGLCFGFCLLVIKLNYSIALGAFVIGAIIAESEQQHLIERLTIPLRDMFSAIFFVSVGILFDPHIVIKYIIPVIIITLAVILGKIFTCTLGTLITGRSGKTAMKVGMGLAQIGEFSFIIASLGITLNVTSNFLYPIAVAVSAITTLLTPYLIKYSDPIAESMSKLIPTKISSTFGLYTTWLQGIQYQKESSQTRKTVRRSIIQIVVNLFIVMAIFFSSIYIAETHLGILLARITSVKAQKTFIWSGALIFSLPFLIAVYRKLKALSMILAELSVRPSLNEKFTLKVRKIISEVIPIISLILIMLFIIVLSSRILPPIELLIVLAILIFSLAALLFPWCIKLHARLQIAFLETLQKQNEYKQ